MRTSIRNFVEVITRTIPLEGPIYEFGALQVPGQEGFADLRPLFPGEAYVGCDMRAGAGVDRILDLHAIDLPDATAGTVLCLDTLEHVEYPHVALRELHRILKPGGIAVISSVMQFPIHDHPCDYWRFTPEGFGSLLKPFPRSFVGYAGDKDLPHTVVGIGFKGEGPSLTGMEEAYAHWQAGQNEQASAGPKDSRTKTVARLLLPPLVFRLVGKTVGVARSLRQ